MWNTLKNCYLTNMLCLVVVAALCGMLATVGCGVPNSLEEIRSVQSAIYTGPVLKIPLPPGYRWQLNTKAGDLGDPYHQGTGFYSLDFGRNVKDNNNNIIDTGNRDEGGIVDVLAAAPGIVLDTDTYPLATTGCSNNGIMCQVNIDHGGGYVTRYFHFKTDTIMVRAGDTVTQGQFLGKMGNTGISTGTHLHFQIRYNSDSSENNQGLVGIALEGIRFVDYQVDTYYPSTNGFSYDSQGGANPRTCSNGLTRATDGSYACTGLSAFQTNRNVFSDVLIRSIQRDLCFKAEVWLVGNKVYDAPPYCSNGIASGSGLYYNSTDYPTTATGNGVVKYFVRTKDSAGYLPAPLATVPFTVLGNTNQPGPTITTPQNWSIQKTPQPLLGWSDAPPWQVTDHDLNFWIWNGTQWTYFGSVNAWPPISIIVVGLPIKWIAWQVRSCGPGGCSQWSNWGYFELVP